MGEPRVAPLDLTCETCGAKFQRLPSQRGKHDYCSQECYHRGRARPSRTVLNLVCEHCGTAFTRFKGAERARSFCSRDCYLRSDYHRHLVGEANGRRNPDAKVTEPCGNCGAEVTRYASSRAKTLYCSRDCHNTDRRKAQKRQMTAGGYVRIFVGVDYPGATKSGHIFEHRKVMQDVLGRPLTEDENVHHKNGQRHDNRPENLELWSRSQPHGQRVEDKIRWAREFLALYEKAGGTPWADS